MFSKVLEGLNKRFRVAIATIVDKKGSGPRDVGAKIVVWEDGSVFGTLGGGPFERGVIDHALKAIKEGKPLLVKFSFTGRKVENAIDTGLICGGVLTVYIDVAKPSPKIFVVGAGRIGKPLADILNILGYRVYVADPLIELANKEVFPYAEEVFAGSPEDIAEYIIKRVDKNDIVLIVHGEINVDYTVLKKIINSKASFIGLLGSKRKVIEFIKRLVSEGIPYSVLKNKLHAPIGIDIGSRTPEEIAVSIASEVIAWINNSHRENYSVLNVVSSKVVDEVINKMNK